MNKKVLLLLPFLLLALGLALWSGLIRLGWQIPVSRGVADHGALMVGSFLGSLIILERAVVLKKWWAYAIPVVNVGSLPLLLLGFPQLAYACLIGGSLGLLLIFWRLLERQSDASMWVMLCGAACWLIGNVLLLRFDLYPMAVFWWVLFLLLTISGERLELSRFLPVRNWQKGLLFAALGLCVAGVLLPYHGPGRWVLGVGLIGAALWLLRFDIARKTARKSALPAFSGRALLLGYGWLVVCGGLLFYDDGLPLMYDAVLHAFFLGFVFSMIFAHGPIILPAVAGLLIKPYHWLLYVPLALLQGSLVLRLFADGLSDPEARKWSGLLSALAILFYFVTIASILIYEQRKRTAKMVV
ncbi:hypothetical protein [Cesiribacter andamanensis]|uniref:NnrS protein n=1 Tax=Cesiribacter andamanensis AMV16 TaxID=1279009 RepID=M7N845_9BACT|nr:hypothetical protein [Cesiribacter andamanensis]EMR03381.1 hypothetical protein ADICEAN_01485 [Cesiribacter andamanensis AMV16]